MKTVKRYLAGVDHSTASDTQHKDGVFVLYTDYAKLEAENARLRKQVEAAKEWRSKTALGTGPLVLVAISGSDDVRAFDAAMKEGGKP